MIKLSIPIHRRIDFVDITSQVQHEVASSGVNGGTIMIYVPHTTCGITINESADPHVVEDIQMQWVKLVSYEVMPQSRGNKSTSHCDPQFIGV